MTYGMDSGKKILARRMEDNLPMPSQSQIKEINNALRKSRVEKIMMSDQSL